MEVHSWGDQKLNQALVPEEEEEEKKVEEGEEEEKEEEDDDDDDDDDDDVDDDDDDNDDGDDDSLKLEAPVLCTMHWGILAEDVVARSLKVRTQDLISPTFSFWSGTVLGLNT